MSEEQEGLSFEESLHALEEIVSRLEAGDLALEESLELFERGQHLVSHCNKQLQAAALRVEQLTDHGEIIELEV